MIFESIKITEGIYQKYIEFSNHANLIFSNKNSTGKTTLLRFLLYSIGYSIPSTKKIRFNECVTETVIKCSIGKLIIIRNDDYLEVKNNNSTEYYILPNDLNLFHSKIFNTENMDILNNLLGAFYLDQEKGWTLLNRGVIIGKNRFNIEQLVRGLSDRNCTELLVDLKATERELIKYRQMFNVSEYQKEINELRENIVFEGHEEEVEKELSILTLEQKEFEEELKRVNQVINENNSFKNYIEKMKIMVRSPLGEDVPVNKNTIIGFNDNIEFLLAKRRILTNEISSLTRQIQLLQNQQTQEIVLMKTESMIQSFDQSISKMKIDAKAVNNIIEKLEREKSKLNKAIAKVTRYNNEVIYNLYKTIDKYAKELGFEEYIKPSSDYIFTDDLKSLSGAILHKIVFAFKLAYIIELQKKLNITLPIILDSPSGREVTRENTEKMIQILNRDFQSNQIIVASVFNYQLKNLNTIILLNNLIDEPIKYN